MATMLVYRRIPASVLFRWYGGYQLKAYADACFSAKKEAQSNFTPRETAWRRCHLWRVNRMDPRRGDESVGKAQSMAVAGACW